MIPYLLGLFRWQKRLLARFFLGAIGRSVTSLLVVTLSNEFLSGTTGGGGGGLRSLLDARFGAAVALEVVAGLLFASYIGAALLNFDFRVTQQRITKVIELGLIDRLVGHVLALSVPYFDSKSHGDLLETIRGDVTQLRLTVHAATAMVFDGALAVGLTVAALMISPTLTLWAFIALPLALLPIVIFARRTLARSFKVRMTGYVLFDLMLQMFAGIRVIKTYGGEAAERGIAVGKARLYFDELIGIVRTRSLSSVILESLAGLGIVTVVVVGGYMVGAKTLEWPALVSFVIALRALQAPLNNLNQGYLEIKTYGASVARIQKLLAERVQVVERDDARPLPSAIARIRFDDVSFGYDGRAPVLAGLSFEVRAGETIGIVGPSGAGKSTLLNLIARFYDPTSGSVRFDDADLRSVRLASLYEKLAIVTQEPFLFATTVRDNIRYGRPGAADAEVEAAARAAFIHDEVLALPDGYETVVGIGGRKLSVGQQQRLNVARALLKNAPILLLDEATSALDSIAEAEVQRAIERLMAGRTSFVIAHRLSTLRNADRILVIEQGRVVGFAPHEELLGGCEVYRRLWEAQRAREGREDVASASRA
jgi:ABC-type multidrug transport system fused ATPase/permease subunit